MIYLDNAATTKPFDSVLQRMQVFAEESYFNPSALYAPAFAVAKELEQARQALLSALGGQGNLYFTSCATESNAWVFGSGIKNKKGNIVVSMGEHASVYENVQACIGKGLDVRFVRLQSDGRIDTEDFLQKIDAATTLVSIIHCSNETGAINNLKLLTYHARSIAKNVLIHSDGVQAFGKIPTNCTDLGVDLYSISAHKIGGPKGVGALWVRDKLHLAPLLRGGGQEGGTRSGTENTVGIIGFAQAAQCFSEIDRSRIAQLREALKEALCRQKGISCNEAEIQSPFVLSLSIEGIKAEILQRKLSECGILVGLGSACAARLKTNRVLNAMGRSAKQIEGSIRLSFGPHNANDDFTVICNALTDCIRQLRGF